jgi:predicted NBD/HSP70 family sugar kinase
VQSLVADAVAELGVEPRETLALSLGVPGIVDPSGRVTLSTVIPDWTGFHVEKHFGRWAGVPVTVASDANMATLAEHWIGAARLVDDVVYVFAGRRTSAGIIVDGTLHNGRHGAAGEIGSIPELYFSTEELLATPGSDPDSPDAIGSVFRAAESGDEHAAGLVEEFYRRLANVVEFMVKAFDPDMVVLGGGTSRAGRFNTTPVVLSQLGPEAVALGAVRSALQLAVRHSPLLAALVTPPLGVPTRPVPAGGGLQ